MTAPRPGSRIRVQIPGQSRAYEYVVLPGRSMLADAVLAARPSRKHPGDYISSAQSILLDWIID